ncbi:attG domain containing protein [Herbaspirillum robiniae]|uniref:AttG domain containing protein n=1 Tax=Herbaspirillum robiniae TaxID=2014887 RepID=A0A246WLW1_9BURK|nr:attG domain containing protein [Herbaspirillum robiniae]OWY27333.1 attG domain containing protein [Herbaspirillum robiniae]
MPTLSRSPSRLLLYAALALLTLLAGCDRSVDRQLAEHAAAETTLGVTPKEFARRFNEKLPDALAGMQVDEPAHMANLYKLDPSRLHPGQYEYVLETKVGPSQTSLLGTLNQKGELRAVGVLLTDRSQAARDEFLICADSAARSFIEGSQEKLLPLITRLTGIALNNPGQRMTEVVSDQLLSVEVVSQGLLFQVQPKQ